MDGGCSKCSLMHIPGHLILLGKNIFKNEKIDSNVKKPKKRMYSKTRALEMLLHLAFAHCM